jgi:hypothetical protein
MESTKEVISSLKFIGKLQKGDKINTKFMYRQPDGIATRISRTLINVENRQNTISFLQSTINSAFEIIVKYEQYNKSAELAMCIHIVKDLKQSKTGLEHLKNTYASDLKFCCDIETMLQVIDVKLREIEEKYTEDKEESDTNLEL